MNLKHFFSLSSSTKVTSKTASFRKELLGEVQALQGKVGHTLTKLRMIGFIEVNGKRFEAKSDNGVIQPGVPVKIIGNAFGVLVVTPIKKLIQKRVLKVKGDSRQK